MKDCDHDCDNCGKEVISGPSKDLMSAAIALASHLYGNDGLDIAVDVDTKTGDGALTIYKDKKVLFKGESRSSPMHSAASLVKTIIEVEGLLKTKHQDCYMCSHIIRTAEVAIDGVNAAESIMRIKDMIIGKLRSKDDEPEVDSDKHGPN